MKCCLQCHTLHTQPVIINMAVLSIIVQFKKKTPISPTSTQASRIKCMDGFKRLTDLSECKSSFFYITVTWEGIWRF